MNRYYHLIFIKDDSKKLAIFSQVEEHFRFAAFGDGSIELSDSQISDSDIPSHDRNRICITYLFEKVNRLFVDFDSSVVIA